jgi:hypothetical protein
MAHNDNEQFPGEQPMRGDGAPPPQDQVTDASLASTQPKAGALVPMQVCPHCDKMIPTHVRRCPYCGQPIPRGKRITRPQRQFAEAGGAPWTEAAERVAELGELTWETEVHPLNEDTHPITAENEPPPYVDPAALIPTMSLVPARVPAMSVARRVPVRHLPPIPALALATALVVALGVVFWGLVVPLFNSSPDASQLAIQATHAASRSGHSTAPNGPGDGTLPVPTPTYGGYPGVSPTGTPHASPTPHGTPSPQPTGSPMPTATVAPTATPTPVPTPQLVLAIDAGGGAYGAYSSDMDVQGGNTYANPYAQIDTSHVTNPAPPPVYQSERWGVFTYTLSGLHPGANYIVRLHFAEIYFNAPKERVFNVFINNQLVLDNFDIVATAGGPDIALVETFVTQANPNGNGSIVINFTPTNINWPKLSGLEVYTDPAGAGNPAGGGAGG